MNLLSWILVGLVAAWFVYALIRILRNRGGCSCGGGHSGCSGNCSACSKCSHEKDSR